MEQAVILAGGKGTRLRSLLGDSPKPMIPIGGRPLLSHQIELCRRHGVREILLLVGDRAEQIEAYCGDGSRWGVRIDYEVERELLGTAGAVLAVLPRLAERVLVLYGDEMVNVDLGRLERAHRAARADATLFLHPNDHPLDSDLVEVDDRGWVTAFHGRPHAADACYQNLVNAALYMIERAALEAWSGSRGLRDFGKDLFPAMLLRGGRLLGYRSPEYVKDIGTPGRYEHVCRDYESGLVATSSLAVPQKAVFLDRDGTLNTEIGGVCAPEQLELLPGVGKAVAELNRAGWRVVVITNQPVVAKGFCTEADVKQVHNRLETRLADDGAFLDRIYWCPHHPERGFAGERTELKVDCACRKPKPGLIFEAARELNIDLSASWLVGDSTTDLATAAQAGVRSILVRTGLAGRDGKYQATPDRVADDLPDAVEFILGRDATRTAGAGGGVAEVEPEGAKVS